MDLFIPRNLDLHEDGSVTPHNFIAGMMPKEGETLTEFNKRYEEATKGLKPYEKGMWIPYEQERNLYKISIYSQPVHPTKEEEDSWNACTLIAEKLFLEEENALKYARNKIKQQSVGYYYSKYNPNKRKYKFFYNLIHNGNLVTESAINGKII